MERKRIAEFILTVIEGERDRVFLWFPVVLASGTGLYFLLSVEPPPWVGPVVVTAGLLLAWSCRRHFGLFLLSMSVLAAGMGFATAQWRSMGVEGVMIAQRLGPTRVEGRVERLELREKDIRTTLVKPRIRRLPAHATPYRIRIVLRGDQPNIRIGDWVDMLAVVTPPPPPTAPGGFDFQRMAYFQELGGTGFALGPLSIIHGGGNSNRQNFGDWVNQLRLGVAERIERSVAGESGAVIIALMTGQRGGISKSTWENIRASGLAHLLAISGLHLGLIAATLFFSLRFAFALNMRLTLSHDTKKWAALIAIVGALAYTVFTGATIPTQRAFLMTGLVMLAVIVDRDPFSMRLVAVSASAILLFRPESLLNASFQMSFAAVVSLVAVFEILNRKNFQGFLNSYAYTRPLAYLITVGVVTMVASLATAPYTLYHFHQIAAYGLVANLIAVPVMALWVMPLSVVAFALMPLGWEGVALQMMSWGVDLILACATNISGWNGATLSHAAVPVWGVVIISIGGVWLCLWRTRLRLIGVFGIAMFPVSMAMERPPDLLVDAEGALMAIHDTNGRMYFSSLRRGTMSRESWLQRAGTSDFGAWPAAGMEPRILDRPGSSLSCDILGCRLVIERERVAILANPLALIEDCRLATILIISDYLDSHCLGPALLVDKADLRRQGAHAFWFHETGYRVETVNQQRGDRPWVVKPYQ